MAPAPPTDLDRVAGGLVPLDEAFLTLARYQEEHARAAAALRESETWALTALLARSAPIWQEPARPTLRFEVSQPAGPAPYHLELGGFAHLAALAGPTVEEQALVTAPVPSWARVTARLGRQQAGHASALAYFYTPMDTSEAIELLGCRRILARIEEATRAAGQVQLAEAQSQAERRACLLVVERMLRVAPDLAVEPHGARARGPTGWMLTLIGAGTTAKVLVGAYAAVVLLCVVLIFIA
jgi:hypothetical protein